MKERENVIAAELLRLKDWMGVRRYSEQTIHCYISTIKVFFDFFPGKIPEEINQQDITDFNVGYILKKGLSASYQSQFVNALKLHYRINNHGKINTEELIRPKKPFRLPKVIGGEDIVRILNATKNIKHKTMLSLMYSAGLRRGELLNMKIGDIDSVRMLIHIRAGKGNRDRAVPLSFVVLEMLREYYKIYKPKDFLFEGQRGGRYSERSIELVLKKSVSDAGIKININLHTLRHSYATHLMESGTHLRYIQELLGHKSPRTTQIYTHVSASALNKIISPIDRLKLK